MKSRALRPVAFIGPEAATAVEKLARLDLSFLPVEVPAESRLADAVAGLAPLGFLGAVLSGPSRLEAPRLLERRAHAAERDGAVDAVAVHGGGAFGTHTLADALVAALETAGFRALGGHAVVLGSGPAASAAAQLSRLGLRTLTLAAPDRPAAEALARRVPAGVRVHAISLDEPRLADELARADLIVHCSPEARLDPRWLAPFHSLLEAAGETSLSVALERAGGSVVPYRTLAAHHLSAQLEFVTGVRLDPAGLV